MGLDYSYLLYFKREHLWDVLLGVANIAEPHYPPVTIHFPGHVLTIPFDTWVMREREPQYDDPEFSFDTVLNFEPDETILDYISRHKIEKEEDYRGPPLTDEDSLIPIGYIYLTVYQEIEDQPKSNLVLFDFGTTGTRMSMLFNYSTSIRKSFLDLLKKYQGVCGVFNKEEYGELFWLQGKEYSETVEDAYMMPGEIEIFLKQKYGSENGIS
jgi:hypothetical protein